MDLELKGKKALVTGSTAGIGFAIAKQLAVEGAEVVVTGRSSSKIEAAVANIEASGAKAIGVESDMSTAAGADVLIKEIPQVDILVNNVGIYEPKSFFDIEDSDWNKMFEVNVMSGIRLSRHYMQGMLEGIEKDSDLTEFKKDVIKAYDSLKQDCGDIFIK